MKAKQLILILLVILLMPGKSFAVEQETIDSFTFLLLQREWDYWGESGWDDTTLIEGLTAVYEIAVAEEKYGLETQAMWAMGETGLVDFVPLLTNAIDNYPSIVCVALRKICSADVIPPIIGKLDDEDDYIRGAAIMALGKFEYYTDFTDERDDALAALDERLLYENEAWVLEKIVEAYGRILEQS